MLSQGKIRTSLLLAALMICSSALAGCTNVVDDDDDVSRDDPNDAPKEAMGMWWPTIDGIIDDVPTLTPNTEWSDSLKLDIEFTCVFFGAENIDCADQPAELRYKSVDYGMALAVEIDGIEETPQQVIVEFPNSNIVLTSKITTVSEQQEDDSPFFEEAVPDFMEESLLDIGLVDFLMMNKIATIHDLDDDLLTMEASAKALFDDTTETTYSITIVFSDTTLTYTKITNFDWVLPFMFPRSDLSIEGIEVTQAIQTADMQMRLVKGKASMARVYVDSGDLATANVEVGLRACVLFLCSPQTFIPHVAVQNPDRTVLTDSANFILPDGWVSNDIIVLIATVRPLYTGAMDYVDPDTSNNNQWGLFWFNQTRDFTVWAVPLSQNTDAIAGQEFLPQATIDALMRQTEHLMPVSSLNQVDFPTASSPNCNPGYIDDAPPFSPAPNSRTSADTGISGEACNQIIQTWLLVTLIVNCGFFNWNWGDSCLGIPWPDQIHGMTPVTGNAGFWDVGGISSPGWGSDDYLIPGLISNSGQCGPGQPSGLPSWTCVPHEITHNLGPYCMDNNGDTGNAALATPTSADDDCVDLVDESWGAHLSTTGLKNTDPCQAGGWDQVWNAQYGVFNIKDLGWNALSFNPDTSPTALVPSGYPDYMSYCAASLAANPSAGNYIVPYRTTNSLANGGGTVVQWTSTIRWDEMYDKFLNWEEGDSPDNPYNGRQSQNNSMRIISGMVPRDGSGASLDHSWTAPVAVPSDIHNRGQLLSSSEYSIVALDQSGNQLEQIGFNPTFLDANRNPADHHFTYILQDDIHSIHSIELLHNGTMVDSLYSTGAPVIRMLPLGTTEYTRENPANLSWTQASPTSNRETLYQLEYSWGDGKWLPIGGMTNFTSKILDFGTLPAGDAAKFRVRATNGFDTYYSESTSFSVPNQAPELTLKTSGALGLWNWVEFTEHNYPITQGATFSIKPIITDADWTPLNENGCSAVLKRDGEPIWDYMRIHSRNRVASQYVQPSESSNVNCKEPTSTIEAFTFPNADLLPGEMKPGAYEFEMTYVDAGGASVTQTVSFDIIDPTFTSGGVLDEYRANLVRADSDVDLSMDELRYYVELGRAARGDDHALSDAELSILAEELGISVSRAGELEGLTDEN